VRAQLGMVVVLVSLDRRIFDRSVHPLDLTIGPGMVGLCEAMFDPVVGENRVDLVGHGFEHVLQELPGGLSVSRGNELGNGELGCPVDTDEEKELALDRRTLAPLRHRLRIDSKSPAQLREPSVPPSNRWRAGSHYCSSDGVPSPAGSNRWRRAGSIVALP
jgi:hypothetical protein